MGFGGVQAVIGSFGARLGLDTTDYARGILNADSLNRVFGANFASFVANPLLGSIQILKSAGQALLSWSADVLDTAESVAVFASEINASTAFVQALKAQYEATGRSFEASKPTLKEIVAAIQEARDAASPAAKALAEIGVSLDGVTRTDQAVAMVVAGINRVEDSARRTHLAMQLLGTRSGPEFLAVVGDSANAIAEMEARARSLGLVMDTETLRSMGALDDQLDDIQQAIQGVRQTATAGILRGFASEFLGAAGGVENFAQAINTKVEPTAERLGQLLARMVGSLDDVLDRIDKISSAMERAGSSRVGRWVTEGLVDGAGDILTGDAFDSDTIDGAELLITRAIYGESRANQAFDAMTRSRLRRTGGGR